MTKQNETNQTTEEKQILNEGVRKLDEEELAGILGAGPFNAQMGLKTASKYGGNWTAKVKSYIYGLTSTGKEGKKSTRKYAIEQASKTSKGSKDGSSQNVKNADSSYIPLK